jgi:hypothetical protein
MARRIWLASYRGRVYCTAGRPNTCNNLRLLQADPEMDFNTPALARATDQINEILAELRSDAPEGHHLAAIDTYQGLLLAYAEAIPRPDDISEYVRAESPEEVVRATLGLRDGEATSKGAAPSSV